MARATAPAASAANALVFPAFVLLTGTIFTRPSEIVPGLEAIPVYEILIVTCIAICLPRILEQLTLHSLRTNPITLCVAGMLVAVVLSRVSHFELSDAITGGWTFTKVLLYYLLLVSVLHTPERLRAFLLWLVGWMLILSALPLLQYYGLIDLSFLRPLRERSLDETTGQMIAVTRVIGIGIYADPNDLSHILATGVPICLYAMGDRSSGSVRYVWLVPLGLFLYTIMLTQSRGGFIALMSGVAVFAVLRFGWRKSLLMGLLLMPALLLFSDRQIDISTQEQTGQERIQMWSNALVALRENLAFGLGAWKFGGRNELVAHNSYMQAFAELGVLGGCLFLGTYFLSLREVGRLAIRPESAPAQVAQLLPCLCGAIAAYAAGMLTLTRNYIPPTYLFPGLAAACLGFAYPVVRSRMQMANLRLARLLIMVGGAYVIATYVFVRLAVRW